MRIIAGKYKSRSVKGPSNMKSRPLRQKTKRESIKARLAGLASQDIISLPSGKRLKKFRPFKVSGVPLSKMVIKDRR
jgi:hypothetical protein